MSWPALDYGREHAVYETVHAYLQVVGKLPVRTLPWVNHGWHTALQVVPRGFRTYTLPAGDKDYELTFDMLDGSVSLSASDGGVAAFRITGQTVAMFQEQLRDALKEIGCPAPLHGGPNEVEEAVPFEKDERPRIWDKDVAARLHGAFLSVARVFSAFRSGYLGKSSPVHLFWGSFDLAVTRFSGRRAPAHPGGFPNLPDRVTREAYSHEVVSFGFWPGGGGMDEAAFYAYTYPAASGFADAAVRPEGAAFDTALGEFLLPYALVRNYPDPDAALMQFLSDCYSAGVDALGFPRDLTVPAIAVGTPPSTN
ncbi:DUF5996 family protein [Pacificimonas flava]|uniref:Ava_C0101 and related proteins n=1 Tax=Pacificimonas flava TaxID=1234595 RepID=M2TLM1_9SPHN|nr:DUF5996 family protein [Pacificimonas flava]EMD82601.1 hypothetical protein C725_1988 [Pacificimonas flava]MBB5281428.1 hypothetical protein [Pacificimonas flava]